MFRATRRTCAPSSPDEMRRQARLPPSLLPAGREGFAVAFCLRNLVATRLVSRPHALAVGVVSCPKPAVIPLIGVAPVGIPVYRLSHHDLKEGEDGALRKAVDDS
jgi:hypothetical protein